MGVLADDIVLACSPQTINLPVSTMPLSEKVQALIRKSRIVSFSTWQGAYPEAMIQCFQAADDEGRYLTDADLTQIKAWAPETAPSLANVQLLRDQVNEIVDTARSDVLQAFPGITDIGGSLYPAERANACWRDFWHFLRCITYGIAGQRTDYTSPEGLEAMGLLYQELQVPLGAMVTGLEAVKATSLVHLGSPSPDVSPYFDHLIAHLRAFSQLTEG